ncbi:MAG: response regulator [Elusimicrobiota bacterium]|jgi:two-component system chemotaxis response regulator CheY
MKHILVVDDDRTLQGVLRMVLERAGYQVSSALDGMQGTMLSRTLKPDLIVLDMMMPAGGGFSVYERIRQMSGTLSTPVLVYSALPMDQIRQKLQENQSTRILSKPADPQKIIDAVAEMIGGA